MRYEYPADVVCYNEAEIKECQTRNFVHCACGWIYTSAGMVYNATINAICTDEAISVHR